MIGFRDAVRGSLALALALSLSAGASRAGPVDDFYRGRTLNFYVGAAPGGGYDITARLMANHFGRFIPGNPSVVVKNMPGASSLQLANYMYNTAPKDGSEIGMPQNTIAFEPLFKLLSKSGGNVQFDPHKYGWIGNPVVESMVVISWHTAALHSYKDLLDKSSFFGASGTETDNAILPTILKRTTGAKLQIVPGYQGPNDLFIALERGEIDAIGATGYSGLVATKGAWLRDRKINVLMQFGMKADPRIPDVPMALDVASSAQDRAALELIFGKYQLSRSVFAPPGVPAERLAALREAFDKMTADAGFRADAGRMGLDITLVRGEEIDAIIDKTYAAEPKVIERARELVEPLK
jgi:tripartite-type tricarboxylate transporter receptor subunit TctC